MHAVGEPGAAPVPAFLTKLWTLVEDPSTDEFICWDVSGKSFHVFDQGRFSKEVLPLYFKHSNIASFIRQLNMYGFRKVVGVESGGLKVEKDDMEFAHQYFQRENEGLLEHIKRKVPNVKADEMKVRPDDVQRVLNDVRAMKGKQENVNSKLESVKRENELLWLEIASLRQKHMKQQQIVNKLIQFLMSLVGNRGVKRKMPLMLNDSSQLEGGKVAKFGPQLSIGSMSQAYQVSGPEETPSPLEEAHNPHTLSIHEVTDQMPAIFKERLMAASTAAAAAAATSASQAMATSQTATQPSLVEDGQDDEGTDILEALVKEHQVPLAETGDAMLTLNEDVLPLDMSSALPTHTQALEDLSTQEMCDLVKDSTSGSRPAHVVDAVLGTGPVVPAKTALPTNPKMLNREMSDHLEHLQSDLDSLKDMLSGGQYTFEPSTIMGMFELGGMTGIPTDQMPSTSGADFISGNEVVQYNPPDDIMSLFDLGDLSTSTPLDEDDGQPSELNTPYIGAGMTDGPRLINPNASTTTSTEEVD